MMDGESGALGKTEKGLKNNYRNKTINGTGTLLGLGNQGLAAYLASQPAHTSGLTIILGHLTSLGQFQV
jgi:hypothetical protein